MTAFGSKGDLEGAGNRTAWYFSGPQHETSERRGVAGDDRETGAPLLIRLASATAGTRPEPIIWRTTTQSEETVAAAVQGWERRSLTAATHCQPAAMFIPRSRSRRRTSVSLWKWNALHSFIFSQSQSQSSDNESNSRSALLPWPFPKNNAVCAQR